MPGTIYSKEQGAFDESTLLGGGSRADQSAARFCGLAFPKSQYSIYSYSKKYYSAPLHPT